MDYRTILTHDDGTPASDARIATAIRLAEVHDAHLTLFTFEVQMLVPSYAHTATLAGVYDTLFSEAEARLDARVRMLGARLDATGLPFDVVRAFEALDLVPHRLAQLARLSDLALHSDPDGQLYTGAMLRLLERALFAAETAQLVLPARAVESVGSSVLIAWNGGAETIRAVRQSMPFLRRARGIEILMVDPEDGDAAALPGRDLATYLARHDLSVTVETVAAGGRPVAEILRERAGEVGADLIVMGAYGHSRLREYTIGGATRDMLRGLTVPVL
ncbi:MAG: universal stress protein, partial [Pseudomonadota bacterium]